MQEMMYLIKIEFPTKYNRKMIEAICTKKGVELTHELQEFFEARVEYSEVEYEQD